MTITREAGDNGSRHFISSSSPTFGPASSFSSKIARGSIKSLMLCVFSPRYAFFTAGGGLYMNSSLTTVARFDVSVSGLGLRPTNLGYKLILKKKKKLLYVCWNFVVRKLAHVGADDCFLIACDLAISRSTLTLTTFFPDARIVRCVAHGHAHGHRRSLHLPPVRVSLSR